MMMLASEDYFKRNCNKIIYNKSNKRLKSNKESKAYKLKKFIIHNFKSTSILEFVNTFKFLNNINKDRLIYPYRLK